MEAQKHLRSLYEDIDEVHDPFLDRKTRDEMKVN
jgi:hypothetical protein